jgi:putative redox protein
MAIVERTSVELRLTGQCPTRTRTHVKARQHEVVIDEPAARGGTDIASTPLETLVASLIGCTNVILNKIAERDGVAVDGLRVDAEATLDRRGTMLREEVAVPFPTITLSIAFSTDADERKIASLKSDLGRFCPVSKILRQSGTRIEEVWTVTAR